MAGISQVAIADPVIPSATFLIVFNDSRATRLDRELLDTHFSSRVTLLLSFFESLFESFSDTDNDLVLSIISLTSTSNSWLEDLKFPNFMLDELVIVILEFEISILLLILNPQSHSLFRLYQSQKFQY